MNTSKIDLKHKDVPQLPMIADMGKWASVKLGPVLGHVRVRAIKTQTGIEFQSQYPFDSKEANKNIVALLTPFQMRKIIANTLEV